MKVGNNRHYKKLNQLLSCLSLRHAYVLYGDLSFRFDQGPEGVAHMSQTNATSGENPLAKLSLSFNALKRFYPFFTPLPQRHID